jgi:YkoY family integral membrane protein
MLPELVTIADTGPGFLDQTFGSRDIVTILLLVLLEGVLSIDNALVLGLLAKRVPKPLQKRALTYGLVGAFVFRVIAIATASALMRWRIVKLIGGLYLVYIAVKHLFFETQEVVEETVGVDAAGELELRVAETGAPLSPAQEVEEIQERVPFPVPDEVLSPQLESSATSAPLTTHAGTSPAAVVTGRSFWMAVLVIELTDIAFAVDSILAAIALVGGAPAGHPEGAYHPKMWVIITGGMLGVLLMRVAATMFIKLLERFPRFELSAYLLVIVIGFKLLADWGLNSPDPNVKPYADFHSPHSPAFWIFWTTMVVCFALGFLPKRRTETGGKKG